VQQCDPRGSHQISVLKKNKVQHVIPEGSYIGSKKKFKVQHLIPEGSYLKKLRLPFPDISIDPNPRQYVRNCKEVHDTFIQSAGRICFHELRDLFQLRDDTWRIGQKCRRRKSRESVKGRL
jgi:hypothetical protein